MTTDLVRFAAVESPRASIIVPGWRAAPYVVDCLRSIAAHEPRSSFEVLVSLADPADDVVARIEARVSGATILVSPTNIGFAGVCNRAAARARGEFIVLLNDDAEVEPHWLDALIEAADGNPDAGVVGSRALNSDGTIQEAGTVLWSDGSVTLLDAGTPVARSDRTDMVRVDYCSGVSLLVRADTWRAVSGLDEGYYPAYYEDVDLCLKVQAHGQAVLFQPASTVRHRQGASAPLRYREFLRDRNRARLVQRWPHVLSTREAPRPSDPGAPDRALARVAERPLVPSQGPRLPDVEVDDTTTDAGYLRQELAVTDEYVASLERDLEVAQSSLLALRRRLGARVGARLRALARPVPHQGDTG